MTNRRSFMEMGMALTAAAAAGPALAQSRRGVVLNIGLLGDIQTLNFWSSNDVNSAVLQESVMPRFGYMDANGNVKSTLIRNVEVKDKATTFIVPLDVGCE